MGFESPWNLLWLLGVGAVAVFTLLRPARRRVIVPSLRLWAQAAGGESQSVSRSRGRVSLSWLLLLLGAVLGVLGMSKPVLYPPTAGKPVQHQPQVPPVTLDAFAAELTSNGQVEVFVSLQNNTNEQQKVSAKLSAVPDTAGIDHSLTIAPNTAASFIERIPAVSAIELTFDSAGRTADKKTSKSKLEQRTWRCAKVAVIGPLSALLRRYIDADDILELTPNPNDADVLVTNGVGIPENWTKPVLSINPPSPPTGWRGGETLQNVLLTSAHGADGPILKNVNLSGIAVRNLTPWVLEDNPRQIIVARIGTDAIILRNDPASSNTPLPPRVYIAFDCSEENTNLPFTQQYVVLMGNIFRWIIPKTSGKTIYEQHETEPRIVEISSNVLKPPRENFRFWGYLTAVAILFWITGWAVCGGKKQ